MSDIDEVIGDWHTFLGLILEKTREAGFELSDFVQMDHICYRTKSKQNYQDKKSQLGRVGVLLGENMVNNRPISTFRLFSPLIYEKWRIDCVELPAPKDGKPFEEGLEHSEFVLYDDMQTFLSKHKDKEFDLRAIDRGINPELGYNFDKYSIKFHLLNLPTVVLLEAKLGIANINDN
jgi:uncharacterized protein